MSTETQQLVVAIEGRTRDLERAMARAAKVTTDTYRGMEKRGKDAAKAIDAAFANDNRGLSKSAELSSQQFVILKAAATDAFGSIAAGQSVMTVLTQQAGQVTSAIGEDGVLGLLGGIGNGLKGLVTPATAAMAAIVAVGAAGAYSLSRYQQEQLAIELALTGIGRLSGATADDIRSVGDEAARTGRQSAAAAREIATTLAATGKIKGADLAGITALAPGFAKLFGVDSKEAGAQLAGIFADPVKGAETLDNRLGLLDDKTRQYVRTLVEQGNRQAAIRTLIAAVTPDLAAAAEKTSLWARAWNAVATAADAATTSVGKAMSAPTLQEQLATAKARRDRAAPGAGQSSEPELVDFLRKSGLTEAQIAAQVPSYKPNTDALDAEIAALEERIRKEEELRKAKEETLRVNDASKAAGDLVRLFNQEAEAVDELTNRITNLREKLNDPAVAAGIDGGAEKAVETLKALEQRIEAVTADYRAGGTAAAAALRAADYNRATAGLSSYAKGLADINERYSEQIRLAKASGDAATQAARVASLEAARSADVSAYQRSNQDRARASVGLSGGFVDSVIGAESSGDDGARNPRSSATGAGQFISSTWLSLFREVYSEMAATLSDDAILALRTNRTYTTRLIEEYARRNAIALQNAGFDGSDRNLHLAHFLGSGGAVSMLRASPSANAASILPDAAKANPEVFKRGAASVQDLLDYAERRAQRGGSSGRAQAAAVTGLRAEAEAYNKTAVEAEKLKSVQEQLDADKERGGELSRQFATATDLIQASSVALTPELRAQREEVLRLADARAKAAATNLGDRFTKDMQSSREALGRTSGGQSDFDRTRSYGVDPASEAGKAMQGQLSTLRNLQELKSASSAFASGFASDMARGATALDAFRNQLTRVADKLISMATDMLVSKAFGAILGGGTGAAGGGLLSGLGSLFGFADGGFTGHGGKHEPAGIVHRGEYVIPKSVVDRIGLAPLEALRKGYADGGLVGRTLPTFANDAPLGAATGTVSVSTPIHVTVQGGAGNDPRQNEEVGNNVARAIQNQVRAIVGDELRKSRRPGGVLTK